MTRAFVGAPDLTGLGREVVFVPWNRTDGTHNEDFVADLIAGRSPLVALRPYSPGRFSLWR